MTMTSNTSRRIGAAVTAGALLLGGAAVGATTAQARPGGDGPSVSSTKPKPNAPQSDRWLESVVDRNVTEDAYSAFEAAKITAREAYTAAKEAAGDDRVARQAAKEAFQAAMQSAVSAFDAATLPAEQVQPVADYRDAIAVAHAALASGKAAAVADKRAAKKEAREAYGAARDAATTREEKRAAAKEYRQAQRMINKDFVAAKKEATATFRAEVKAARDALVAALSPVPEPEPTPAVAA